MRILVGLDVAVRNDFERGELELAIKSKNDRVDRIATLNVVNGLAAEKARACGTGTIINLNILPGKPVFVKIKLKAAEHDGHCDQHPLLHGHTR